MFGIKTNAFIVWIDDTLIYILIYWEDGEDK